jgi:hypothetical protein
MVDRNFYAIAFTPNGSYSRMGASCDLVSFKTKAARDAYVAAAPRWGDFTVGARMPMGANEKIHDKGLHAPVRVRDTNA